MAQLSLTHARNLLTLLEDPNNSKSKDESTKKSVFISSFCMTFSAWQRFLVDYCSSFFEHVRINHPSEMLLLALHIGISKQVKFNLISNLIIFFFFFFLWKDTSRWTRSEIDNFLFTWNCCINWFRFQKIRIPHFGMFATQSTNKSWCEQSFSNFEIFQHRFENNLECSGGWWASKIHSNESCDRSRKTSQCIKRRCDWIHEIGIYSFR